MTSLVILAASVSEIPCGRTDKCTNAAENCTHVTAISMGD